MQSWPNLSGPQSTDQLFVHIFHFSELIHNSWTNPHGLLSGFCLVCLFYFCFAFCFLRQEDRESQFSPFNILEIFKLHMVEISLLSYCGLQLCFMRSVNTLSANPTKCRKSRQIVWVCLNILWVWHFITGLRSQRTLPEQRT